MSSVQLEKNISYRFKNQDLLKAALTHKSYANESKTNITHNEKLEFLGDAVIDLALGDYLMELFPQDHEGSLSKKRASLVNEDALAQIATSLQLQDYLFLGKGEGLQGGALKPRLLASGFEALMGALFKDSNYEVAKVVIRGQFAKLIQTLNPDLDFENDYKTRLQEVSQKNYKITPKYELVEEVGPPHDRVFKVKAVVKENLIFTGEGRSKKAAEQDAAQNAIKYISQKNNADSGKVEKE